MTIDCKAPALPIGTYPVQASCAALCPENGSLDVRHCITWPPPHRPAWLCPLHPCPPRLQVTVSPEVSNLVYVQYMPQNITGLVPPTFPRASDSSYRMMILSAVRPWD